MSERNPGMVIRGYAAPGFRFAHPGYEVRDALE
jgi:hypothetical protein